MKRYYNEREYYATLSFIYSILLSTRGVTHFSKENIRILNYSSFIVLYKLWFYITMIVCSWNLSENEPWNRFKSDCFRAL